MTDRFPAPGRLAAAGLHPAAVALAVQLAVLLHRAGPDRAVVAGYEARLTLLSLAAAGLLGAFLTIAARRAGRVLAGACAGLIAASFVLLTCANANNGALAPPADGAVLAPVGIRDLLVALAAGLGVGFARGLLVRPGRLRAALLVDPLAVSLLGAAALVVPYRGSPLVASWRGELTLALLALFVCLTAWLLERWVSDRPGPWAFFVAPVICVAFAGVVLLQARPDLPAARASSAGPGARPDVLLIVLDTTRESRLSAYGAERATSPNLQRLAASGTRFDTAFSTSCWTLPSHASLFTGLYPPEHGANWNHLSFAEGNDTLAERLQAAGYRTAAFSANPWITAEGGFGQGFDRFDERGAERRPWRPWQEAFLPAFARLAGERFAWEDAGGELFISSAEDWIASDPATPWFAFINLMEAHIPYAPPGRFRSEFTAGFSDAELRAIDQNLVIDLAPGRPPRPEREYAGLRALYDGEIAYTDLLLGRLLDFLESSGRLDRTLLIVTADHGENLGDHLPLDHQLGLWDTLTRVPLVARLPGAFPPGTVRTDLVSLVDVAPAILSLAGAAPADGPLGARGALLEAGRRSETFADYTIADSYLGVIRSKGKFDPAPWNRSLQSVRTADRKLVAGSDGTSSCFDLAADPLEQSPLPETQCEALRPALDAWRAALRAPPAVSPANDMSEDRRRALQGLGYIP